jgi:DNA sulfur modification protein DndE
LHIDDGLEILEREIKENPNIDGFNFLIDKIETGLEQLL